MAYTARGKPSAKPIIVLEERIKHAVVELDPHEAEKLSEETQAELEACH